LGWFLCVRACVHACVQLSVCPPACLLDNSAAIITLCCAVLATDAGKNVAAAVVGVSLFLGAYEALVNNFGRPKEASAA
jgi:hypothetical protein